MSQITWHIMWHVKYYLSMICKFSFWSLYTWKYSLLILSMIWSIIDDLCISFYLWSLHAIVSITKQLVWYLYNIAVFKHDHDILMTSPYQILNNHTIVNMLCSKWTSQCMSHLKLSPSMWYYFANQSWHRQ